MNTSLFERCTLDDVAGIRFGHREEEADEDEGFLAYLRRGQFDHFKKVPKGTPNAFPLKDKAGRIYYVDKLKPGQVAAEVPNQAEAKPAKGKAPQGGKKTPPPAASTPKKGKTAVSAEDIHGQIQSLLGSPEKITSESIKGVLAGLTKDGLHEFKAKYPDLKVAKSVNKPELIEKIAERVLGGGKKESKPAEKPEKAPAKRTPKNAEAKKPEATLEEALEDYLAAVDLTATEAIGDFHAMSEMESLAQKLDPSINYSRLAALVGGLAKKQKQSARAPAGPSMTVVDPGESRIWPVSESPGRVIPDAMRAQLSPAEIKGIRDYTKETTGTYKEVNSALRSGRPIRGRAATASNDALQGVFGRMQPSGEPVTLYRGVGLKGTAAASLVRAFREAADKNEPFVFKEYLSTTTQSGAVADGRIRIKIDARKGLDVAPYATRDAKDEGEVLLPNNSKFRVIGIEKEGGKYNVHLEQLADGAYAPVTFTEKPAANKELWRMIKADAVAAAPKVLEPTEDNLDDIGDALRAAMDEAVGSPKDQCIATAYSLKTIYPQAEIFSGTYRGEPHTLAKLAGKFIDVTADQFGAEDEVQILDPENLPREYRRFTQIHDYETASGKVRWETQPAITEALHRTLAYEGKRIATLEHGRAVRDALAAGKTVPPEVLADYPDLAQKPATKTPSASPPSPEELASATYTPTPMPTEHGERIGKVTAGGKTYFWKGEPPEKAKDEALVSTLLKVAGLGHVPTYAVTVPAAEKAGASLGGPGMLAEWTDAQKMKDALGTPPVTAPSDVWNRYQAEAPDRYRQLAKRLRPEEADRNLLFSFLAATSDRNDSNYLVDGDRLVSVDHETSLSPNASPSEALGHCVVDNVLLSLVAPDMSQTTDENQIPISRNAALDMANKAKDMAKVCRDAGDAGAAKGVESRGKILERFANGSDHTLAGLRKACKGVSTPKATRNPTPTHPPAPEADIDNFTPDESFGEGGNRSHGGKVMRAYKLPNGNLLIPKRAEGDGVIGDGSDEVAPNSPEYQQWMRWYARRGETPPALPAPDQKQENRQ